jgi:crossover junction endodeoxyribonuclease RuvC
MGRQSARSQWAAHIAKGAPRRAAAVGGPPPRTPFTGTVLGVDPSLRGTGLAVVAFDRPGKGRYLVSETLRPPRSADLAHCLGEIAAAVARLLQELEPDALAIEETIYVQNYRTAQKLGAARGAAIGQAAMRGVPVFEYSPLRIKQAVVGYGRASKEQVSRQMSGLLGLAEPLPFDEADAVAAAYCHALTAKTEGE